MFFVLSGFLIGRILLRDPVRDLQGLWRFWARRWLRTLPPYYLVLAALAFAFTPGREVLLRYLAFLQCARLEYLEPVFFPVSWSLAVEEWFYLGLPLLLMLVRGRLRPLLAVLLVASAARWLLLWDADFAAAKYFTWLRFDALLWGVLAAGLSLRAPATWERLRMPAAAAAAAGGAVLVAMFWLLPQQHVAMRGPVFTLTSFTFACALPLAAAWRARPGMLVGAVGWLAAISYPLYLVHLELLRAAASALGAWGAAPGIGGALLLAWGMHRLLERPLLAWRDRRVRAREEMAG
jgi:peptidoglycan/LPS O-acetylase OafA/YrhL